MLDSCLAWCLLMFFCLLIWLSSYKTHVVVFAQSSRMKRHHFTEQAKCETNICNAPIYWCCKPSCTAVMVLRTLKKSAKFQKCLCFFASWCNCHFPTNILEQNICTITNGAIVAMGAHLEAMEAHLRDKETSLSCEAHSGHKKAYHRAIGTTLGAT